jgi:hypothetical protein
MSRPDMAVPPLDDELAGRLQDLTGIHPGIDQIRDGVRLLAVDRLTPDQTQTICASIAGSDADVINLLAQLLIRLTDPASNPCLRALPEQRQKRVQHHGEQAAYLLTDSYLHQEASEAAAAIDGI